MTTLERFTIRPRPIKGESLSSFLDRVCSENEQKLYSVLRYLAIEGTDTLQRNHGSYRLDVLPERTIELDKLTHLCGISATDVHRMSLSILRTKIYDDPTEGIGSLVMMSKSISKDRRYYCSECLQEFGVYKLLWQVNDIDICNLHQTRLRSDCPICGEIQPYLGTNMSLYRCNHCHESLICPGQIIEDKEILSKQVRRWNAWNYILYSDQPFVNKIDGYSNEKSCILTLVGLEKQYGIQVFRKRHRYSLLYHVIDDSRAKKVTNRRFSIEQLLDALDVFGHTAEQFSQISIPIKTLNVLLTFNKELREVGPCLAPWCPSFGTTNNMVRIDRGKGAYLQSVCTDCFMEYAFKSNDDIWHELTGRIPIIWSKLVPIAGANLPFKRMGKMLNIDYRKVMELLAYLAHYYPTFTNNQKRFSYEIPSNVVECFRSITSATIQTMKMYRKARDQYGWSQPQFFFYLASREVQMFIRLECSRKNGRSKGATDKWSRLVSEELLTMDRERITITLREVAKRLKCNVNTLKAHDLHLLISEFRRKQRAKMLLLEESDLRTRISKYIEDCEVRGEAVFRKTIVQRYGVPQIKLDYAYPGMYSWISEQIDLHKERLRQQKINNYKELADMIILGLWDDLGSISVKRVAKEIGVSVNTLVRTYPEVVDHIKEWNFALV